MIAQHSEVDHGAVKQGVAIATLSAIATGLVGWAIEEAKLRVAEHRARAKAARGEP